MNERPGKEPGHDPEGRASGPPGEPQFEEAVGFRARSFLAAALSRFGYGSSRRNARREAPSRQSEEPPAKAEADRNGPERRERRERRGVGAAGPSGPDRGGGWGDGGVLGRRSPADRRRTSGGAGEVERAAREHRATCVDDGRPNPSFQYPASYAGVPWSYCRAARGSAAKTAVRGERR
jgi:hypothetical protein